MDVDGGLRGIVETVSRFARRALTGIVNGQAALVRPGLFGIAGRDMMQTQGVNHGITKANFKLSQQYMTIPTKMSYSKRPPVSTTI